MRRPLTRYLPLIALAAALAAPASAGAAGQLTGNTTLLVSPAKQKLLKKRGIALKGFGGVETFGREVRLPISGGSIGTDGAAFSYRGGLRLLGPRPKRVGGAKQKTAKRPSLKLRAPQLRLGPRTVLTAKLKGKRRAIFELKAPAANLALNPTAGTAQQLDARLVWRRSAALTIGRKLGAKLPTGRFGGAVTKAATILTETPKAGPISGEPPLLARPATAVDVSGATLTWHVRDSWIRYVSSAAAPEAIEGAAAQPAYPANDHPCPDNPIQDGPTLVYDYSFPFANGWYDPPTGTTALYYGGGIRFSYPERGIDLTTRNPEIELAGPASRAIMRLRGAGATAYPDSRVALLSLAVGGPPAQSPPGTFSYPAPLKAALTPDGESAFAGFYTAPNNGFGCFTLSFTAPAG